MHSNIKGSFKKNLRCLLQRFWKSSWFLVTASVLTRTKESSSDYYPCKEGYVFGATCLPVCLFFLFLSTPVKNLLHRFPWNLVAGWSMAWSKEEAIKSWVTGWLHKISFPFTNVARYTFGLVFLIIIQKIANVKLQWLHWKHIQTYNVVAVTDLHTIEESTVVLGGGLRTLCALLFTNCFHSPCRASQDRNASVCLESVFCLCLNLR